MPDQDIFADMRGRILAALRDIAPGLPDDAAARIEILPARNPAQGDVTTNAALVAAGFARRAPAAIAADLAAALRTGKGVAEATAAGAGSVNIRLRRETLRGVLPAILAGGGGYGVRPDVQIADSGGLAAPEGLDERAADAVRLAWLMPKPGEATAFDPQAALAQTRRNPVFCVQHAYARCRSVLRAAAGMFGAERVTDEALAGASLGGLEAEAELAVARRLMGWPRAAKRAAEAGQPHIIAFFLYELASDFHILWDQGHSGATLRFVRQDQPEETMGRLALVAATAAVIRSGLAVLGVAPVEELR